MAAQCVPQPASSEAILDILQGCEDHVRNGLNVAGSIASKVSTNITLPPSLFPAPESKTKEPVTLHSRMLELRCATYDLSLLLEQVRDTISK